MMKRILAIVAAMTPCLVAFPALASNTATYGVTGTVTAICSAASTGTLDFGTGGLANASTGVLTTSTQSSNDATALCNGVNTTLSIAHVAMQTAGSTTASGFVNTIDFIPRVTLNNTNYSSNQSNTVVGAFSGMTVSAVNLTTAGSARPIAGSYNVVNTGSITLTLTAAP